MGPSKKIEQEASGDCHYSEYLTLLNTSQDDTTVIDKASPNTIYGELSNPPPQTIDEKELYGC